MSQLDPYRFAKDLLNLWQKPTAEFWDAYLHSPLYTDLIGNSLEMSLTTQKLAKDLAESWWEMWGIPTHDQQEKTLHKLNEIDTQVKRLSRRVDKMTRDA